MKAGPCIDPRPSGAVAGAVSRCIRHALDRQSMSRVDASNARVPWRTHRGRAFRSVRSAFRSFAFSTAIRDCSMPSDSAVPQFRSANCMGWSACACAWAGATPLWVLPARPPLRVIRPPTDGQPVPLGKVRPKVLPAGASDDSERTCDPGGTDAAGSAPGASVLLRCAARPRRGRARRAWPRGAAVEGHLGIACPQSHASAPNRCPQCPRMLAHYIGRQRTSFIGETEKTGGVCGLAWCLRQESNLYLPLRRRPFYPLNYGGEARRQFKAPRLDAQRADTDARNQRGAPSSM